MKVAPLDLNLLVVFEAILDARSVSKAAERLGLRQPATSAALARLRSKFGDELFVRAAGAMQPTAKALRIAPGIAAALEALRATLSDAAPFTPYEAERTFAIASTDYTTTVILPAVMAKLRTEAPGVDLRIIGYDKDDIPELIDRVEVDLALGVFRDAPERSVRQPLCPERFVGVCRHDHPSLTAGAMSLEDYVAAVHALVSVRRDSRGELDAALQARGLSRRVALTLPHMLALPGILHGSDLVSAVPERVALMFASGGLQIFELPLRLPTWRIEMLWNPGSRSDPGHAWLRSRFVAAAQSLKAGADGRTRPRIDRRLQKRRKP